MKKRIFAIIILIILVILIVATFISGIIGSEYFWVMFVLSFLFPIIIWAIFMIEKLINNKDK